MLWKYCVLVSVASALDTETETRNCGARWTLVNKITIFDFSYRIDNCNGGPLAIFSQLSANTWLLFVFNFQLLPSQSLCRNI